MPRVAFADLDDPTVRDLAAAITAQRGAVLDLYKVLMRSPALAEGWLAFLTAVRQRCALSGRLREMVILRVAHLNKAPYEAQQHGPYALREGLSGQQIDAPSATDLPPALFSDDDRTVVAYVDAMTRTIRVPDALYRQIRAILPEPEVVELTATIAAYNMVSRFLEALEIH